MFDPAYVPEANRAKRTWSTGGSKLFGWGEMTLAALEALRVVGETATLAEVAAAMVARNCVKLDDGQGGTGRQCHQRLYCQSRIGPSPPNEERDMRQVTWELARHDGRHAARIPLNALGAHGVFPVGEEPDRCRLKRFFLQPARVAHQLYGGSPCLSLFGAWMVVPQQGKVNSYLGDYLISALTKESKMFPRIKIIDDRVRRGGRIIHTDPVDGPPRYDLRKPSLLYDPDLDNREEPDPDIIHDPFKIEKDKDPNLNMHDPDLDVGGVNGRRIRRRL